MKGELAFDPMGLLLAAPIGYLLGLFNAAYYLGRLREVQDIRRLGSGNAGATNAGRLWGPGAFAVVFGLDAAKGALAVVLARVFSGDPWVGMVAWGFAVAGHVWPVQLGCRGGKGVSTYVGGLLVQETALIATAGVLLVVALGCLRRWVAGGLIAVALTPLASLSLGAGAPQVAGTAALALILWVAHRRDLRGAFGMPAVAWPASPGRGTRNP